MDRLITAKSKKEPFGVKEMFCLNYDPDYITVYSLSKLLELLTPKMGAIIACQLYLNKVGF